MVSLYKKEINQVIQGVYSEINERYRHLMLAREAMNSFQKSSICELKALGKPPQIVLDVLNAVHLILRGKNDLCNWNNCLKLLGNPMKFIQEVIDYDKPINDSVLKPLQSIISNPNFNWDYVLRRNIAASYLCAWVINIVEYNKTFK